MREERGGFSRSLVTILLFGTVFTSPSVFACVRGGASESRFEWKLEVSFLQN